MASKHSTLPTSEDGSARPKSRKQPGKVKRASAQHRSGKRLTATLAQVPLKQIHLSHESIQAAELAPRDVGNVIERHYRLLALQMLPVLVQDRDDPSIYRVLAHERLVRWIKTMVEVHDILQDTLVAVVVSDFGVTPEEATLVERHLLPLVLGRLSRADMRAARKALKEGGIPPPRKRTRREQLKPLIGKREGALEG